MILEIETQKYPNLEILARSISCDLADTIHTVILKGIDLVLTETHAGVLVVKSGWHKADARYAATYNQLQYFASIKHEDSIIGHWPFPSTTNAQRSLTKAQLSEMIDHVKAGGKIRFE